jgi:hypothetical protein
MHPLLHRLLDLGLPSREWALFGSGPLLVRGWIDRVGDLDLLARRAAWDRALEIGEPCTLEDGIEIVSIDGGAITVGRSWRYGDFSIDDLIATAEVIAGIPCVLLEHVAAYKRIAGRPKDLDHLAVIERHTA